MTYKIGKKKLDEIGSALLKAASTRESEIDEIVSSPDAYPGIQSAIDCLRHRKWESYIPRHSRMHPVYAIAVSAFVIMGTFASVEILKQYPSPAVLERDQDPGDIPVAARFDVTPQVTVKGFTAGRATDLILSEPISSQKTLYIKRSQREEPTFQNASAGDIRPMPAEFVPVTYTGDRAELLRGGRVVRVDISRAELFAMGIDVPLENETASVKAEIVVGPDGVTRALRLLD